MTRITAIIIVIIKADISQLMALNRNLSIFYPPTKWICFNPMNFSDQRGICILDFSDSIRYYINSDRLIYGLC